MVLGFGVCASVRSGLASLKLLLFMSYPCHSSQPPRPLLSHCQNSDFLCLTLSQILNPAGMTFFGKTSITSTGMFAFIVKQFSRLGSEGEVLICSLSKIFTKVIFQYVRTRLLFNGISLQPAQQSIKTHCVE